MSSKEEKEERYKAIRKENERILIKEIYGGCFNCRHPLCRDGDVCGASPKPWPLPEDNA